MNGKPFVFFTYTDFHEHGRKANYGRHTTIGAAKRHLDKLAKFLKGNLWVEDLQGNVVAGFPPSWLRQYVPDEAIRALLPPGRTGTYRVLRAGEPIRAWDILISFGRSGEPFIAGSTSEPQGTILQPGDIGLRLDVSVSLTATETTDAAKDV